MKTQPRNYYAINYWNGVMSSAATGNRRGTYYRFSSPAAREQWINDGGDYRTGPNWREAILSKDPEVRVALRGSQEPWCEGYPVILDGEEESNW